MSGRNTLRGRLSQPSLAAGDTQDVYTKPTMKYDDDDDYGEDGDDMDYLQ